MTNVSKPLSRYAGYRLTRTKLYVRFGCGAVSIRRADLLALAAMPASDRAALNTTYALGNRRISTLTEEQVKQYFKGLNSKNDEVLNRVVKAAKRRYAPEDILRIKPETLRGIAG